MGAFFTYNCHVMEKRTIYLDHAAATPLDPRIKEAMLPYLDSEYGNPSAIYSVGRMAKEALDNARQTVAQVLGCTASEVIFTGSGTESDNLAIFGVARGYTRPSPKPSPIKGEGVSVQFPSPRGRGEGEGRGHLITTNFEHHAVLNPCKALEKEGYEVTYLKVDRDGLITPEQLKAAIRPDTLLVSVIYANNEIGTIEPIAELARALREWKKIHDRKENDPPFFHTDACQAAGYLEINVKNLGVDLMTINGSKIYGPKGTGALYVRRGLRLKPLIYGGGQEFKLRSGTENVAGIVGLAKALEITHHVAAGLQPALAKALEVTHNVAAGRELEHMESERITQLRDKLINGIMENVPGTMLNGHATKRLPNNINITILDIEGEAMLLYLDEYGICASTGSACDSQTSEPSHVIQALGKSQKDARSSIRFTLGRSTTETDINYVLNVLPEIVQKLRKI